MKHRLVICWFRRDLRLHDHAALAAATRDAAQVVPVFVFDRRILDQLVDQDDRRVNFIYESLKEINPAVVLDGDPVYEIPQLAKRLGADAVYTNRDYEPYGRARDEAVATELQKQGRTLELFKDHVIFEGSELKNQSGAPYKVFTPYKNLWLKSLTTKKIQEQKPELTKLWVPSGEQRLPESLTRLGFKAAPLWLQPGQRAGQAKLKQFMEQIHDYAKLRDFPALEGTSGLSVHLRFGTISIRETVRAAREFHGTGAAAWLNELIWRDFYHMVLDQYPHTATGAFRKEYDAIQWPGKTEHFEAWCEGRTGYPIVDAAMRQLNKTGFMHNRLRMIVASFLSKDLLIDWRLGERYFARKLLDYDMASNVGGWQWAASVGTDAQPYFRVFNPESQAKKFDPSGEFVRKWCPEIGTDQYPKPIVVHSIQRERAIRLFSDLAS